MHVATPDLGQEKVDLQLKYLEFIQGVVNRMGQNSANTKGWATLLLGGFLTLHGQGATLETVLALIPGFAFWLLDAYYLRQERLFRVLFSEAAAQNVKIFSMSTSKFESEVPGLLRTALSKSIAPIHLPVVVGITLKLLPLNWGETFRQLLFC